MCHLLIPQLSRWMILLSILSSTIAQYPDSISNSNMGSNEVTRDHVNVFRDGDLARVLSKLLNQNAETVQRAVGTGQGYVPPPQQNANLRQQPYGPSGGPTGAPLGPFQQQNSNQYRPPPERQQQYSAPAPPPERQQGYGSPQNQQQYGPPLERQQGYGPPVPVRQEQYGPPAPPPERQQQYGPPQNQQQYGPPPERQQGYGPPEKQQQEYGPPEKQQGYGAPEKQQQYGTPQPPSEKQKQSQRETGTRSYSFSFSFGDRTRPRQKPQPQKQFNQRQPPQMSTQNSLETGPVPPVPFQGEFQPYKAPENFQNQSPPMPQPLIQPHAQQGNQVTDNYNKNNNNDQRVVYVFGPPQDAFTEAPKPQVIRRPQKPDVNYQIIFVKAPSPPSQPQMEIQMPNPPEHKTLVYVLVKKPDHNNNNIRFTKPLATTPAPPEVFFVKYRKNKNNRLPSTSDAANYIQQSENTNPDTDLDSFVTEQIAEKLQNRQPAFLGDPRSNLKLGGYSSNNADTIEVSSGGYQNQRVQGGYTSLTSQRSNLPSTSSIFSSSSSHYTAPGSRPWDNSAEQGGRSSGSLGRMRLTTSNYIPQSTSSIGGYAK